MPENKHKALRRKITKSSGPHKSFEKENTNYPKNFQNYTSNKSLEKKIQTTTILNIASKRKRQMYHQTLKTMVLIKALKRKRKIQWTIN